MFNTQKNQTFIEKNPISRPDWTQNLMWHTFILNPSPHSILSHFTSLCLSFTNETLKKKSTETKQIW